MNTPVEDREGRVPARFESLSALGKAVYLAGATARTAATVLENAIDRAAGLVANTERAFREGRDGSVEDAHVITEHRRERRQRDDPR